MSLNYEGCLTVPNLRGEVPPHVRPAPLHGRRGTVTAQELDSAVALTAGTFQHELDHLDGVLFVDRVTDPRTFSTWEGFDRFHREDFEQHARELVDRVGS